MKAAGGHRAVAALASLAILALGTSVLVGPAAGTSGGGTAEAAKKKCKKKKAGAAKKKKCKKKKKKQGAKPAPLVRATLTWDTEATDFDLWVFDSNGNRGRAAANPIPNTAFSANDTAGLGPETFTDLIYVKPGRNFSFGVCFEDGGSDPTVFTLDYVTADGVHHIESDRIDSDAGFRTYNGGAPIPVAPFCKT
jgi:hypothetical protein